MAKRSVRAEAAGPWPLERGEGRAALLALQAGQPYRDGLEALLRSLPPRRAELLMQLLREGRGAYLPLLSPIRRGARALLIGNSLSGTAVALARLGYAPVLLDPEPERAALALWRDRALGYAEARAVVGGKDLRLPFGDASFDLVVQEGGEFPPGFGHPPAELARVCAGEWIWIADNRFAYKRSLGVRGEFLVPSPWRWARTVVRSKERSLRGYRRLVRQLTGRDPRAYALYPHAQDFSHVVALGGGGPRLTVGPKERQNALKVAAARLGLFPLFAPSFALLGGPNRERASRLDGWLEATARAAGETVRPRAELWIATRGNTALVLSAAEGGEGREGKGRYALHIPLSPQQEAQARAHFRHLVELRRRFQALPLPAPILEADGQAPYWSAERRLGGWNGAQVQLDSRGLTRLYGQVDEQLGSLVVRRTTLDEGLFARLFEARFEAVGARVGDPSVRALLDRWLAQTRARVLGAPLPLVFQHADLRAKHIQMDERGNVLGYLDWGSAEREDLPWFDLANLVLHDHKQRHGCSAGAAWSALLSGAVAKEAIAALDSHRQRLGLEAELTNALLEIHPLLVAAMAERNWDYSRPRWLANNFLAGIT